MSPPENVRSFRIGIVGGGPGGLVTAYFLQQRLTVPCSITIFEASGRLGGKILTASFASRPVPYEAGAAELYDYSPLGPDPLRELIAELGLRTHSMQGGAVVMGGHVLQNTDDLKRHLGPAAADALRLFRDRARALISPQDYYASDWQQDNTDPQGAQSFHDLLGTIPDLPARRYVQVSTHSDLACEPAETNASYGLQNYLMDEADYLRLYTIEGGIERLPEELARRLEARVLLDHRVTQIEQTSPDNYRITAQAGSHSMAEDFDFVVVALPNNWLTAIEWRGGRLPAAMHAHHQHYNHPAHYLRVSVLFDQPFWRERISGSFFMLEAFGGCCVYDESARGRGHGFGALGWLLAGDAALNLSNLPDAELIDLVMNSLPEFLRQGRAHFLEGRVHRWVGAVNALPAGFPVREPDSRHVPEPEAHPGLFVVGDYLFDSTLNGVVDSADVVVEYIREEIQDELVMTNVSPLAESPAEAVPAPVT